MEHCAAHGLPGLAAGKEPARPSLACDPSGSGARSQQFEAGPSMRIRQADVSTTGPCPALPKAPPCSKGNPPDINDGILTRDETKMERGPVVLSKLLDQQKGPLVYCSEAVISLQLSFWCAFLQKLIIGIIGILLGNAITHYSCT